MLIVRASQSRYKSGPKGGQWKPKNVPDGTPKPVAQAILVARKATAIRLKLHRMNQKEAKSPGSYSKEELDKTAKVLDKLKESTKEYRNKAQQMGYKVDTGGKVTQTGQPSVTPTPVITKNPPIPKTSLPAPQQPQPVIQPPAPAVSPVPTPPSPPLQAQTSVPIQKPKVVTKEEALQADVDSAKTGFYDEYKKTKSKKAYPQWKDRLYGALLDQKRHEIDIGGIDTFAEASKALKNASSEASTANTNLTGSAKWFGHRVMDKVAADANLDALHEKLSQKFAIEKDGSPSQIGQYARQAGGKVTIYPKKPTAKITKISSKRNSDIEIEDVNGNKRNFQGFDIDENSTSFDGSDKLTAWFSKQKSEKFTDAVFEYKVQNFRGMNCYLRWRDMGHSDAVIDDHLKRISSFRQGTLPMMGYYLGHGKNKYTPKFLDKTKKHIDNLTKIMDIHPLEQDTVLNRAVGSNTDPMVDAIRNLNVGDDLPADAAYTSSSLIENVAKPGEPFYNPALKMKILAPKGTKGAYLNADPNPKTNTEYRHQQEYLLAPYTRFRLIEKTVKPDGTIEAVVGIISQGESEAKKRADDALIYESLAEFFE